MKIFLILLLSLLAPELVFAQTISPGGKDAWDLFVSGNGRVIADTLEAISLLMAPDAGNTGYRGLMVLVAVLGFLVLAIKAGFQPTQGLLPMFGYIFVAWIVGMFTFSYKANVTVNDPVNNYYHTVSQTPALATLPAALVSEVGVYFTRSIETYFRIPAEFKTVATDGLGGSYNLFATMLKESDQFVFRNSNLKKSFSAYIGDCTIPAIALGRLSATAADGSKVTGLDTLVRSTNMMETLGQAALQGVMTRYYPADPQGYAARTSAEGPAMGTTSADTASSFGVVQSCAQAYSNLKKDIEAEGQQLLSAGAKSWSKTGTLVPFESAMSVVQEAAAAGGSGRIGGGQSSFGFIQQQAMLSSMTGALRESAAAVGNNEYIMASAIAQAEQSQKSAWASAAVIFNNMMGYVYAVLQAFIFALTPLVIVAMLIPGLGKGILGNYFSILIWMALWTPMLAIVNYLVTLFGMEQVSGILTSDGGITLANKYVVSEKVNDLMIAAQFLGTMVPLLAWGLVKGSLAFTEFISSGIGSNFATQAGASAATGNLSMGNMSMNNTSANKFNTAISSAVGTQSVQGSLGAGSTSLEAHLGGSATKANGADVSARASASSERSRQLAEAQSVMEQSATSIAQSLKEGKSISQGEASSMLHAISVATQNGFQHSEDSARVVGYLQAVANSQSSGTSTSANVGDSASFGRSLGVEGSMGVGSGGFGGKVGVAGGAELNQSFQQGYREGWDMSNGSTQSATGSDNLSASQSNGVSSGGSMSNGTTVSGGTSMSRSSSYGTDISESFSNTLQSVRQFVETEAFAESRRVEESMQRPTSLGDAAGIMQGLDQNEQLIAAQRDRALSGRDGLRAEEASSSQRVRDNIENQTSRVDRAAVNTSPSESSLPSGARQRFEAGRSASAEARDHQVADVEGRRDLASRKSDSKQGEVVTNQTRVKDKAEDLTPDLQTLKDKATDLLR